MKKEFLLVSLLVAALALSGCIQQPVCGNGACEAGENQQNCMEDCKLTDANCSDGTTDGSCSITNGLLCNNGKLEMNCEKCVCTPLIACSGGNCGKRNVAEANYNCTFCNGFCFATDSRLKSMCENSVFYEWNPENGEGKSCLTDQDCTLRDYPRCVKNVCLQSLLHEYPTKIAVSYPRYVQQNKPFSFKVDVENTTTTQLTFRLFDVFTSYYNQQDKKIGFDEYKEIAPKSKASFEITSPGLDEVSAASTVFFRYNMQQDRQIYGSFGWESFEHGPIIVGTCPESETEICGDLKYCPKDRLGICSNGIFYPVEPGTACSTNSDCESGLSVCLNHSCRATNTQYGLNPYIKNEVGILGIFIYNDNAKFEIEKKTKNADLKWLTDSANAWVKSERAYWNATNDFDLEFTAIEKECKLDKKQYLELFKSCESGETRNCTEKELAACGIEQKFDVIAMHEFFEEGLLDQEITDELIRIGYPGSAGLNEGNIVRFSYNTGDEGKTNSVLIHETLHSFGEQDLYITNKQYNSLYQERNCNLYNAIWSAFDNNPHLCELEAKLIGWKQ
ncbi:MAG: hypothetical protein WC634_00810 [archaeon]